MAKKINPNPKIHVNPSGRIPPEPSRERPLANPNTMASGFVPPMPDGAPMCDPAKEAAKHVPPAPDK